MSQVKPEIKVDPAEDRNDLADIEEFDEATDLLFPDQRQLDQGAWLVKVSDQLWKAWNDVYQSQPEAQIGERRQDSQDIQVGTLRVYHQKEGEENQRVQIRLRRVHEDEYRLGPNDDEQERARKYKLELESKRLVSQKLLPEVYELDIKARRYNNTVVFSEQDLPGHRTQQTLGGRSTLGSKPVGIQYKNDRYGQKKPGTYRTAIPKKTALAAPIRNEAIANPVEDDTSLDFFKLQYDAAMNAGRKTTFINKVERGAQQGASNFTFGTLTSKPKANKKKQAKEKAVRMSRNELLDRLQNCFKEYQYWPLRALRNKLNQPEAWLKEVLEDIAYPMRSGDFAGNYRLNEQSARLLAIDNTTKEEQLAPDNEPTDQGSGYESDLKDEDEDMNDDADEFEDVLKTDN